MHSHLKKLNYVSTHTKKKIVISMVKMSYSKKFYDLVLHREQTQTNTKKIVAVPNECIVSIENRTFKLAVNPSNF